MTTNFNSLKWKKGCFHVHTPASNDYGFEDIQKSKAPESEEEKEERIQLMKSKYIENRSLKPHDFLMKFINKNYNFIVVTDHQSFEFIGKLRQSLDELRTLDTSLDFEIFPGIEVNLNGFHAELIFDPEIDLEILRTLIIKLNFESITGDSGKDFPWDVEKSEKKLIIWDSVEKIVDLFLRIENIDYMLGFPHVKINSGIGTIDITTRNQIIRDHRAIFGLLPKNIQYKNSLNDEFQYKGVIPIVITSDYHGINEKKIASTWIKLEKYSIKSLRQCLFDPESRIRLEEPIEITYPYISRLTCPGLYFGNSTFIFSPHINVIIGGRGTGKSAICEFIFFLLGKLDSVWKSADKDEKKYIIKIISKMNHIIGRNAILELRLENFRSDYPQILIRRELKYQTEDILLDYHIDEILSSKILLSHESKPIPFNILKKELITFSDMYFQEEFQLFANKPDFALKILHRFFEKNPKFETSEITKEIELVLSEITQDEEKIKNGYNYDPPIDPYIIFNKIEEVKKAIKELKKNKMVKVTKEEEKIQLAHTDWVKLKSINKSNRESEKNLEKKMKEIQNQLSDILIEEIEFTNFPQEIKAFNLAEIQKLNQKRVEIAQNFKLSIQNTISNLKSQSISLDDNKNLMKKKWNHIKKKHTESYEVFQKKRADLALFNDKLNHNNTQILELQEKKKKNLKKIKLISSLEKKRFELLEKFTHLQNSLIKRRNNSIKFLNNQLPEKNFGHLSFKYDFSWDYIEFLKNQTERIQHDLILKLCKNLTGIEFVKYLEINYGIFSDDIIKKKFDSLKFTKTTKQKLTHLYPIEQYPKKLRGIKTDLLFNIEKARIKEEISVFIKKNGIDYDIKRVSPGEMHRNLLLLALIPKNCPLIFDQPEDHLDFDVKNKLPFILRENRNSRQFFIVTHFQNIPVLSDAEKIFYLEEKNQDQQLITTIKEGAFESMVDKIINLEGGPEAILMRKDRYSEFVDFVKTPK